MSLGVSLSLKKSLKRPTGQISLGEVPSAEFILKSSIGQKIEKLCGHSEWQPRILYVTADMLLIAHPDHASEIADQIPLVKVTRFLYSLSYSEFFDQHQITSSDRTNDGHGEGQIWIINTEEKGYNNGRQVATRLSRDLLNFVLLMKRGSMPLPSPLENYSTNGTLS